MISPFLNALNEAKPLTNLDLAGSKITRTCLEFLAYVLKFTTSLEDLDLGDNAIKDADGVVLFEALQSNRTLISLHLAHNQLGLESMRSLSMALRVNTTLMDLDLSHNKINGKALEILSQTVGKSCSLTSLNLANNAIQHKDVTHLIQLVRLFPELVDLDLAGNALENASVDYLRQYLRGDFTLKRINLTNNNIEKLVIDELNKMLARTLVFVSSPHLQQNDVPSETIVSQGKPNAQLFSQVIKIRIIYMSHQLNETRELLEARLLQFYKAVIGLNKYQPLYQIKIGDVLIDSEDRLKNVLKQNNPYQRIIRRSLDIINALGDKDANIVCCFHDAKIKLEEFHKIFTTYGNGINFNEFPSKFIIGSPILATWFVSHIKKNNHAFYSTENSSTYLAIGNEALFNPLDTFRGLLANSLAFYQGITKTGLSDPQQLIETCQQNTEVSKTEFLQEQVDKKEIEQKVTETKKNIEDLKIKIALCGQSTQAYEEKLVRYKANLENRLAILQKREQQYLKEQAALLTEVNEKTKELTKLTAEKEKIVMALATVAQSCESETEQSHLHEELAKKKTCEQQLQSELKYLQSKTEKTKQIIKKLEVSVIQLTSQYVIIKNQLTQCQEQKKQDEKQKQNYEKQLYYIEKKLAENLIPTLVKQYALENSTIGKQDQLAEKIEKLPEISKSTQQAIKNSLLKQEPLVLSEVPVTPEGAQTLFKTLADMVPHMEVTEIKISHPNINQASDSVKQFLVHPALNLKKLDLSSSQLEDSTLSILLDALIANRRLSLETLLLRFNKIENKGAQSIGKLLAVSESIKLLDLRFNNICDEGAYHIAQGVLHNTSLTRLDLGFNKISGPGAKLILHALFNNKKLSLPIDLVERESHFNKSHCSLIGNPIGLEGVEALKPFIEEEKRIRRLNLQHCGLDDKAIVSLCGILKNNSSHSIEQLSLYNSLLSLFSEAENSNKVGLKGAKALNELLLKRPQLFSSIDMNYVFPDPLAFALLIPGLKKAANHEKYPLKSIGICGCGINENSIEPLLSILLKIEPKILSLANSLDNPTLDKLFQFLMNNPSRANSLKVLRIDTTYYSTSDYHLELFYQLAQMKVLVNLKTLGLNSFHLTDDSLMPLLNALPFLTKLKILDLSYNKLTLTGLKNLIVQLQKNSIELKRLDLYYNLLKEKDAQEIISCCPRYLLEAMSSNLWESGFSRALYNLLNPPKPVLKPPVVSLDNQGYGKVSRTKQDDSTITEILHTLLVEVNQGKTLVNLDLSKTYLTAKEVETLINFLLKNSQLLIHLHTLNVSHNAFIDNTAVQQLVAFIENPCCQITCLNVQQTAIDDIGLAKLLKINKLEDLISSGNNSIAKNPELFKQELANNTTKEIIPEEKVTSDSYMSILGKPSANW
jgi:Ran GTPase-activating protein (RanGAP) involved in mRNA processing and transport